MYVYFNANPKGLRVGDCTIRAISKALDQAWEKTYMDITMYGLIDCDMPSANHVWGHYLTDKGFVRELCQESTVRAFADNHSEGIYILAISGHVVAVVNGAYYDTFDSGDMTPIYYWKKEK